MVPDLINGLFEISGGFFILMNVRQMWRDKMVRGVHWGPTLFFTSWGLWNLYYYPHLDQWISFAGGMFIVAVNAVWLAMMIYYWRR